MFENATHVSFPPAIVRENLKRVVIENEGLGVREEWER